MPSNPRSILTSIVPVVFPVFAAVARCAVPVTTGYVPFSYHTLPPAPGDQAYRTYYELWGSLDSDKAPLIALHGGPGADCDYMRPGYGDLANVTGRPVLLYDQFGCGRSSHIPNSQGNNTIWDIEMFMAEFNNLVTALHIKTYSMAGQSSGASFAGVWGSRAYKGNYPARQGLKNLILASGPARMSDWHVSVLGLVNAMGPDVSGPILEASETGNFSSPEYQSAINAFYAQHFCRIDPFPPLLQSSFQNIDDDPTVYTTMNGPDEINTTGNMRDFDIVKECSAIDVPTLLINGEFDEAQNNVMDTWRKCLRRSKVNSVTVANASHMLHLEHPTEFTRILKEFLD
ncbi:Alpha/Beta hydrolase protein [Coniochaeta sp. 2T2.1]|nr:Alpha/Beta hydrolase protein [Coniochaeta sp. 2T2.1]